MADMAYKKAWDEYIYSEEGKKDSDFHTLTRGPYLENRLRIAFQRGWDGRGGVDNKGPEAG